ncbi:hypothetical protein [Streptococcus saliviloxodontae]|uniref:Uncharacterized protein n=1 Tax=Streptococcus saliviloxodontae TaxID=1349416 RepID=A0ABS2PK11_9STRE|nr:hypothetical protein [Streptococcus saliviloxodontae]MBM7635684.1 hypothetical protein [Streptococcus saliviloxodontae]
MKKTSLLLALVLFGGIGYYLYDAYFIETDWYWTSSAQDFASSVSQETKEKVSKLEVGKSYDFGQVIKLVDESHFVYYYAEEYTSSELEEAREDAESDAVYPTIWFGEGSYRKDGDDYYLLTTREVKMIFSDTKTYKAKHFREQIETPNLAKDYLKVPQLSKSGNYYQYHSSQFSLNADGSLTDTGTTEVEIVSPSSQTLPNNLSSFLAQYQPESSKS